MTFPSTRERGLYDKYNLGGTFGAHTVLYDSRQRFLTKGFEWAYDPSLIPHELHHVWDSRAFGNHVVMQMEK